MCCDHKRLCTGYTIEDMRYVYLDCGAVAKIKHNSTHRGTWNYNIKAMMDENINENL